MDTLKKCSPLGVIASVRRNVPDKVSERIGGYYASQKNAAVLQKGFKSSDGGIIGVRDNIRQQELKAPCHHSYKLCNRSNRYMGSGKEYRNVGKAG
jgi:hypothetical protein